VRQAYPASTASGVSLPRCCRGRQLAPGLHTANGPSIRCTPAPHRRTGGCLAGVGLEADEDGVADLALEAPERFLVRLSLGQLLVVIGPAVAVPVPDLSNGGHVDGVVDAPVAAQRQPVDLPVS
jgi:hypothetical protein